MDPEVSGYISNILLAVDDPTAQTYPSGQVANIMFASVPKVNAIMGFDLSGDAVNGTITPSISGHILQGILELYVAKELTKKSLYTASRKYNLVSITEGDSKISISDVSKSLSSLYEMLSTEFDKMVDYAKYSISSVSAQTVIGSDNVTQENLPFIPIVGYRPYYW